MRRDWQSRSAARERSLLWHGWPAHARGRRGNVVDYREVSVVGITEVLKQLPSLRRAMDTAGGRSATAAASLGNPHRFSGISFAAGPKALALAIRNVYYICPQFWAWRPWRANLVREDSRSPLHFSVRREVLSRCRGSGGIHRPPPGRQCSRQHDPGGILQKHGLNPDKPIVTIFRAAATEKLPIMASPGEA